VGVVILPDQRWSDGGWRWQRAEALGFAHAWTYDHINWRSLRDGPWFGAIPTLTLAATTTSSIRLGTLVASPNFRHPVPFARDILALDDGSAGRLTVGLGAGAGATSSDATVLGQEPWSPRQRAERYDEFVTLLDALLSEEETTWRGRHYSAVDAAMRPGSVQRPRVPFVLAASGPRGMRLTARLGQGWVTTGDRSVGESGVGAVAGAASVRAQMDNLDAACAAVGRDPSTLERFVLTGLVLDAGLGSAEEFRDTLGAYEQVGVTDLVVHWPRDRDWFAGDIARFESVIGDVLA
jgi:alkanesulfonate monooxygenase SsuD/methylene tetrahydromethanopterin reductase-like flavin-dependent oxidoreductase (luciferase family)